MWVLYKPIVLFIIIYWAGLLSIYFKRWKRWIILYFWNFSSVFNYSCFLHSIQPPTYVTSTVEAEKKDIGVKSRDFVVKSSDRREIRQKSVGPKWHSSAFLFKWNELYISCVKNDDWPKIFNKEGLKVARFELCTEIM